MNSTNHDENEPPPSEDEDRSLLFGPPKEGTEPAEDRQKPRGPRASASPPPSRTSPPAAEAVAEPSDPAGRAGPVASSDAVQRRILALLEDLEKKLAGPAADATDPAAAVRTIAEQIAAATEWVNNIKAAISDLLASTGKQIEGLKSGQKDHDAALARLKLQEKELDRVVQALNTTAKDLNLRSSDLKAVKQELAKYYGDWTAKAKTSLAEMKVLSKRLDAGDHMVTRLEGLQKGWTERMEKSIGANSGGPARCRREDRRQCDAACHDGHRVPEGFRHSQRSGTEGGPAGVDAHSALDGTGAGNRPGARRAVVCVCRRSWAERVRRLRPL